MIFLLQLIVKSFKSINFIKSLRDFIIIVVNYCKFVLIFIINLLFLIILLVYDWYLLLKVFRFIVLDFKWFWVSAKFNFVNFFDYFFIHLLNLFILQALSLEILGHRLICRFHLIKLIIFDFQPNQFLLNLISGFPLNFLFVFVKLQILS